MATSNTGYENYKYKGASMLDAAKNLEPARNNNFQVYFPNLGSQAENIMLSVASYSAPTINVSTITASYGNSKVKFAGLPEFPDSTIVLNDYITLKTQDAIMAWHDKVYDPSTDIIGYASEYKMQGILYEFTTKGSLLRSWDLQGCWPSSVNLGDFNQEGGSIRQISVTLVYDKISKRGSDTSLSKIGTNSNARSDVKSYSLIQQEK